MSVDGPDTLEEKIRDRMVRELRQNLTKCRKIIRDENMDLKTRERWTQLYNNTSTGPQPDPERQTDARLGEENARNRRIRKEPEDGRPVARKPQKVKNNKLRELETHLPKN